MNALLALLVGYAAAQVALGLWLGRAVRGADGFFVAGRALGPGLLFATLLAANVGAGSTVGASGLGYRDGLAAWWWVGSAAIGSLVQALWVGPALRRDAAAQGLTTVGDWLEWRYSAAVRGSVAALLWLGSLAILAGQLVAMATVLEAITGMSRAAAAVLGGGVVIAYFAAGGLRGAAGVNVVQVTVKVLGFGLAVPIALAAAGGWQAVRATAAAAGPEMLDPWRHGATGWPLLFVIGPAFIVSPGLLQKVYGARDDAAVRWGVGLNALGLLGFALFPVALGLTARTLHPALPNPELALPTLLARDLPPAVGALGLAALFSAELSAADAVLFMLSTSLAQDLYHRVLRRDASDRTMLRVVRGAAAAAGALGIGLAVLAPSVVSVLSLFYGLMSAALFVPVVGALVRPGAPARAGLWAVLAGAAGMLAGQFGIGAANLPPWCPPSLVGVLCSAAAFWVATLGMDQPVQSPGDSRREQL